MFTSIYILYHVLVDMRSEHIFSCQVDKSCIELYIMSCLITNDLIKPTQTLSLSQLYKTDL